MPFCTQCGFQLNAEANFCSQCGQAVVKSLRTSTDASQTAGTCGFEKDNRIKNMTPYVSRSAFWSNFLKGVGSLICLLFILLGILLSFLSAGGLGGIGAFVLGALAYTYFSDFSNEIWEAVFGTVKYGKCPYCNHEIRLSDSRTTDFDCPICKNRISIEGQHFIGMLPKNRTGF